MYTHTRRVASLSWKTAALAVVFAVLTAGLGVAQAQEARIETRPLTPQEIHDLGLPETTQRSGGLRTVGTGQPAYLEVQVDKGNAVTQQVVWTIQSAPLNSVAVLEPSPIPPEVPVYSPGDREVYDVVSRQMLRPDKRGSYTIVADVTFSNSVMVTATQKVTAAAYVGVGTIEGATPVFPQCGLGMCHGPRLDEWAQTKHATKLTREISGEGSAFYNEGCIECHTVGFDETPGAVNGGFDDVAAALSWSFPATLTPTNWTEMPPALQNVSNIQCENCHGPGSEHYGQYDKISVSLSSGDCGQCHDEQPYHVKNTEWNLSRHAVATRYPTGTESRRSCVGCHSGIGFIDRTDGLAQDDYRFEYEAIVCAACHDPHVADNPHQIRTLADAQLANGVVVTEGGKGKLCMQCHQARRDAVSYVASQLGNPSSHFGPHYGTQTDMLVGTNAIEYGVDTPRSRHLFAVEDTCVHCHLQEVDSSSPAHLKAGGHTFKPSWDNDTPEPEDDVDLVGACVDCHGPITSFDFGGEDYDDDGVVEGVQTEIHDLVEDLGMLLPPVGSPDVDMAMLSKDVDLAALAQLNGAYNWEFVHEDGSFGVHNPKYAAAILRNSILELTDGVDTDKDNLRDDWEYLHFGNLAAQDGAGDADGDGLSNAAELAMGTDPNDEDSDGDTYSDLAELQFGSDPLNAADTPDTAISRIYTAVELAFLTETGVTYQVQAVDELSGGAWADVGDPVIGNGLELQAFFSTRFIEAEFYRVIEMEP